MISVIVPIFNVENYLRQCIDSIINQTYSDLEIILIDDGSSDKSGEIVDSYNDPRICIFHTANHGLSAARNLGIEKAHGEYLSFVDADDWIEPNLLQHAVERIGSADILCFGNDNAVYDSGSYNNLEALTLLFHHKLPEAIWNKIYRRECFFSIRFPYNRIYEDVATTYKLFLQSKEVKCISERGYHNRYRKESISHTRTIKHVVDYWIAYKTRYDDCERLVDDTTKIELTKSYATAIANIWAWRYSYEELKSYNEIYSEIHQFARDHCKYSVRKHFPFKLRIGILFVCINHPISFWLANKALLITRVLQGKAIK